MAKLPTCPLCDERMVREANVPLGAGALFQRQIVGLAWVCPACSAAFPIALAGGATAGPLYADGRRDDAVAGADSVA